MIAEKRDIALFQGAQVGQIFTVRATDFHGAPKRGWMKEVNLVYRIAELPTGPARQQEIEVEPMGNTKGPKGVFLIRPRFGRRGLRIMILLYARDGRGRTTGHPIKLVSASKPKEARQLNLINEKEDIANE